MKTILCLLVFCIPCFIFAQVKIANQPKSKWFEETCQLHQQKKIKEDSLLKMKATSIPDGFQDTLRKYDWVEIGSYLYVDKKFSVWYNTQPTQYSMFRLADGDTVERFMYTTTDYYGVVGGIVHSNFKEVYSTLPTYNYKKIGTAYYIESCYMKTSKEYLKVISYKSGVLVMDTPMNGKITDKKMFSRTVYVAKQKQFTWSKTENK